MCFAGDLIPGETLANDLRSGQFEAVEIGHLFLAIVEAIRLLIEIAEQVERLDLNVGSADGALQQRPEVLQTIGVDVAVNVCHGVIHNLCAYSPASPS